MILGLRRFGLPGLLGTALATAACLSACGGTGSAGGASGAAPQRASPQTVPAGYDDHACITGGGHPAIAWSRMQNPILSYDTTAAKDQALLWAGGRWRMLFSSVYQTPGDPDHWSIASATSADLTSWTVPAVWPAQAGTLGVASPDVVRAPDGLYVATYTSVPKEVSGEAKLYYRTSRDLVTWSQPQRLLSNVHTRAGDRLIDPALAYTGNGLMLGYKYGRKDGSQSFEIAWSPNGSLRGPWRYVGRPDIVVNGDTIENYEFVPVDGVWRLVATSNELDQPWIFRLAGNARVPSGWLRWSRGYQLAVPQESWNQGPGISSVGYEKANSAYLCDARAVDGYFYLTYAGSDELGQFGGWGHAKVGIARSTDLVNWQVPPS